MPKKVFHVLRPYLSVRYLAVVERPFLLLFIPDAHLKPVYLQRLFFLFRIPNRHAIYPLAGVHLMMPSVPFPLRPLLRFGVLYRLGKLLVRFVPTGEDKAVSRFQYLPAKRLAGIQTVSQQRGLQP